MKKYDKEFFILMDYYTKDFYDSAIGIEELSNKLGKTRAETLRSIRTYMKNETYIKTKDNRRLILFDKFILERGNKKW